jgi:hypothetical protein
MPHALPVPQHIFDAVMVDFRAGLIVEGGIFPEINRRCDDYYAALPSQTRVEMLRDDLFPIPGQGTSD